MKEGQNAIHWTSSKNQNTVISSPMFKMLLVTSLMNESAFQQLKDSFAKEFESLCRSSSQPRNIMANTRCISSLIARMVRALALTDMSDYEERGWRFSEFIPQASVRSGTLF
jgi:hypothetical protein